MDIQDCIAGQAIDYRAGGRWWHGHVIETDDHEHYPLVMVDSTVYDYRPQTQAVEPEEVRPAATECDARAACQQRPK